MTTTVLLWLLASIVIGAATIALGRRGRRINDHPACRQCGFDLLAHYPGANNCPECGAGIKLARFVVKGQRKRMWSLIALGTPLVVLPLATIGIVLFAGLTHKNINAYKPLGLLLWEAKRCSDQELKEIGRFLCDQQLKSKLTQAEIDRIVAVIIDMQKDYSTPFEQEWSAFLKQARIDGTISDTATQTILDVGGRVEWRAAKSVRRGDQLVVRCREAESRLPVGMSAVHTYMVRTVRIGERELSYTTTTTAPMWFAPSESDHGCQFLFSGTTRQLRLGKGAEAGCLSILIKIPDDLPLGVHSLTIRGTKLVESNSNHGYSERGVDTQPVVLFERQFTVRDADTAAIDAIAPTAETTRELMDAIRPTIQCVCDTCENKGAVACLNLHKIQVPLAYKVVMRSGTAEWTVGTFVSEGNKSSGVNEIVTLTLNYMVDYKGAPITLLLVPDPAAAKQSGILESYYNGTLAFEGLQMDSSETAPFSPL